MMQRYQVILCVLACLALHTAAIGQITLPDGADDKKTPRAKKEVQDRDGGFPLEKDKLFIGGNFGLQLGEQSFVELSPSIGYRVTDRLWPGLGLNYQYYSDNRWGQRNSQSIIGWRGFASYQILDFMVAYGEYENLHLRYSGQQLFISNLWLGMGLRQWMGDNSALDIYLVRNSNFGPIQQAFYGSRWNIKMSVIIGL